MTYMLCRKTQKRFSGVKPGGGPREVLPLQGTVKDVSPQEGKGSGLYLGSAVKS